mmetsp:Transcript_1234/g.3703  ORF Transcript_1234/g.3703 Transcript_1234/m.3703 type:complete len:331 (-) Transcript_1234:491-1483(-)
MVRAATRIQDHVPIDPSLGPIVEVPNDVFGIALAESPVAQARGALLTCLGHHQVLFRPHLMDQRDVVVAQLPGFVGPRLIARVTIPMERHAPDVLCGLGIAVQHSGPREKLISVVVPCEDLDVKAALLEHGTEVITDKIALLLRCVQAILPASLGHRLVLHSKRPNWKTDAGHLLGEAHVEARPSWAIFRQQSSAIRHLPVVLHPRRRAPRARNKQQTTLRHSSRTLEERDNGTMVARDAEEPQGGVVIIAARPIAPREVARVDVQPPQAIAQAILRAEARLNGTLLIPCTKGAQQVTCRLRERPAEAEKGLKLDVRLDDHGRLAVGSPR